MPTPPDVLAQLLRTDPTSPRITCYDDTDGPTHGERIELSAKVLANWVAKAANLLQEEWDVAPTSVVRLDLPPHWRTAYWALAVWSVGACVRLGEGPAEVLLTNDPSAAAAAVGDDSDHSACALITLAALARRSPLTPPEGVLDEAADLATQPDLFDAWEEPAPSDSALITATGTTAYADLVRPHHGAERAHLLSDGTTAGTEDFLRTSLDIWAAGGSIVLSRGVVTPETFARRNDLERVTLGL